MAPKRILVVDDDPIHLHCAKEILEEAGYEVVLHAGGFGATEAYLKGRPDLILLDVNMPALSGTALAPLLLERVKSSVPILLYSSNDEESLRNSARKLNLAGFVGKGDPSELRRKVARVLGERIATGSEPIPGAPPPTDRQ